MSPPTLFLTVHLNNGGKKSSASLLNCFCPYPPCMKTHLCSRALACRLQSIRYMIRFAFGSRSQWFPRLKALRFRCAVWYFLAALVSRPWKISLSPGESRSLERVVGGGTRCYEHAHSGAEMEATLLMLPFLALHCFTFFFFLIWTQSPKNIWAHIHANIIHYDKVKVIYQWLRWCEVIGRSSASDAFELFPMHVIIKHIISLKYITKEWFVFLFLFLFL